MKILKKLSLRYQLMLWNTFLILFALITTGGAINSLVKNTVEKNMVKDLTASVVSIQKMINTTVNASIHNYLRGIGEKNVDILDQLNKEAAAGKMALSEAKQMGEKILLNQPIGKTGYIYALTSDAILAVHPVEGMTGMYPNMNYPKSRSVKKKAMWNIPGKIPEKTRSGPKSFIWPILSPGTGLYPFQATGKNSLPCSISGIFKPLSCLSNSVNPVLPLLWTARVIFWCTGI
jgi:hypothetical protein